MRIMNQNHDIDKLIDNGWNWTNFMQFHNMDRMTFMGEKKILLLCWTESTSWITYMWLISSMNAISFKSSKFHLYN
jgi:hypothetical protein